MKSPRYEFEMGRVGALIFRSVDLPGRENASHHRVFIRDYTREEANQVCAWLNGADKPLPSINGCDFPGHPSRR
jgi:hypothetical protein